MPKKVKRNELIRMFQSAPAGEGGRCLREAMLAARKGCFNPRPPVKAGGALGGSHLVHVRQVSIRARR